MDILMIGNSFSYFHNMNRSDGTLYRLAKSVGYDAKILPIFKGGHYLHEFLDGNDPYGYQVERILGAGLTFDTAVLQEQSNFPIRDFDGFRRSVEQFRQRLDCRIVLYATWGYRDDHERLHEFGEDTFDMELKLRNAYNAVGREFDLSVANAGAAWSEVYTEHPEIELYDEDKKHPSPAGSYLSACVLCGTIFEMDPAAAAYDGKLEPETAAILRQAASEVCQDA